MNGTDLQPLEPQAALDWYLQDSREELRKATRDKHESALGDFVEWTDRVGIDDMTDVAGRQLMEYKTWRRSQSDLKLVSLNGNLAILQQFIRFCETIEAAPEGLGEKVPLPNVPPNAEVNESTDSVVSDIRSYFRRFEYASRRQATFELIAEVGIRLGAVRAIDLGDFEPEERIIHLRHRPEGTDDYGTPLKNGRDGERIINISEQLGGTIEDYVDHSRVGTEDEYGREPLFTTTIGRPSTATIRRDCYKMSRECVFSGECPHDREISDGEAAENAHASKCLSSFGTHPLRKWSIMKLLDRGAPKELLSDRVDVSV